MSTLYLLIFLALLFSSLAVGVFIWATRTGQFQDMQTPAMRILFEDKPKESDLDQEDDPLKR